jgi:hypothetical protein
MHPYWIQKIEESRRSAVLLFWSVLFLVVVLPVILVMKVNLGIVVAITCFAVAGLRIFAQGQSEMAQRAAAMQEKMHKRAAPESGASGLAPETGQPQWHSPQPTSFPGPQFTGGVQTTPEFQTSPTTMGVPTNAFGHAVPTTPIYNGHDQRLPTTVPGAFYNPNSAPGPALANEVIQDFSAQQETGPMPSVGPNGQPIYAQPDMNEPQLNRPMHFHDLARH